MRTGLAAHGGFVVIRKGLLTGGGPVDFDIWGRTALARIALRRAATAGGLG
jgi:hypothetical protein